MRIKVILFSIIVFLFSVSVMAESISELDITGFESETGTSKSSAVKNPFTPDRPTPQEMPLEDLYLTGVAVGSGKSYALINGFVFSVGDKLGGLIVRAITKKKVILQRLDRVHILYLEGGL